MLTKSEQQNEIRRAQKAKQRLGTRKNKSNTTELEEVKLNRHVEGKFCGATADAIKEHFQRQPHIPLTTEWFKNYIKNGKRIDVDCPDVIGDVSIDFDDIHNGIALRSVTVFTSGGYGIKFKVIGGFNGKPRRVLIL